MALIPWGIVQKIRKYIAVVPKKIIVTFKYNAVFIVESQRDNDKKTIKITRNFI